MQNVNLNPGSAVRCEEPRCTSARRRRHRANLRVLYSMSDFCTAGMRSFSSSIRSIRMSRTEPANQGS